VVAALKGSSVLEVVDDTHVRRKVPVAEDLKDKSHLEIRKHFENAAVARSVYVKGFGDEQPSTQFDIEAFFTPYGPTNQVRLRRAEDRTFKGSVFVEFDSEETARAFLALDPKPKYKGRDLIIKSKKQYCDEKVEDIQSGRIKPNTNFTPPRGNKRGNEDDDRDWRERREEDRKKGFRDDRSGRGGRGRGKGHAKGDRRQGQRQPGVDEMARKPQGNGYGIPLVDCNRLPAKRKSRQVPKAAETAEDSGDGGESPSPQAPAQNGEENEAGADDRPSSPSKKRPQDAVEALETQGDGKRVDSKPDVTVRS
jgi:hypothetical protein